jgi:hypothetical protein
MIVGYSQGTRWVLCAWHTHRRGCDVLTGVLERCSGSTAGVLTGYSSGYSPTPTHRPTPYPPLVAGPRLRARRALCGRRRARGRGGGAAEGGGREQRALMQYPAQYPVEYPACLLRHRAAIGIASVECKRRPRPRTSDGTDRRARPLRTTSSTDCRGNGTDSTDNGTDFPRVACAHAFLPQHRAAADVQSLRADNAELRAALEQARTRLYIGARNVLSIGARNDL